MRKMGPITKPAVKNDMGMPPTGGAFGGSSQPGFNTGFGQMPGLPRFAPPPLFGNQTPYQQPDFSQFKQPAPPGQFPQTPAQFNLPPPQSFNSPPPVQNNFAQPPQSPQFSGQPQPPSGGMPQVPQTPQFSGTPQSANGGALANAMTNAVMQNPYNRRFMAQ